ncbi:hypothetical protein Swit_0225 [Rhizorhabdus wittichii RW1]|uniref:Uncharacterized protein n=1 Tax=Rhizorhabdus wittichii (strain DSM 6014 / CCUG 31198 / JCM 15750 / NBRC 105917 / EY 4224 / RW1) TaxID=392499 RepID=A0A9J9H7X2_RHIWR|nr:hypothetical protein Swit_0225 [Rhizorhabdus wittichii RW1]
MLSRRAAARRPRRARPRPARPRGGAGRRALPPLFPAADVLVGRIEEGSEGAVDEAQADARADRHDDVVGADVLGRVRDGGDPLAAVMEAQEGDHVVLVDAVAGHADAADQLVAAIDRHRSGEDLHAVLQAVLGRAGNVGQEGAALARVGGRGAQHEAEMLGQVVEDQRALQSGGEGTPLVEGARQRSVGPSHLAVREEGAREIAARAIGEGVGAGQRARIVEEGPDLLDEGLDVGAGVAEQVGRGVGAREEGRGARLLQRHVGAEDRGVGAAHHAEHDAARVDDGHRHLRAAVERLADLRAGAAHHLEGFLEDRLHLGLGQRRRDLGGVGAAAQRVAVVAGAVGQDEGVDIVDRVARAALGRGHRAIAGRLGAIGMAGEHRRGASLRIIARDRYQRSGARQGREGAGVGRVGAQLGGVRVGIAKLDDHLDIVGADVLGRIEAAQARRRDIFVVVAVDVVDVRIIAVEAVRHDADAADHHAVLVEREAARIGGEAERRALRADEGGAAPGGQVAPREIRAGELAELHAEQRAAGELVVAGRIMFLDDEAGGAGREGVARRGQIGAGDRLGDRRRRERVGGGRSGDDEALDVGRRHDAVGGLDRQRRRRAGHLVDGEDVADPVDDRDDGRLVARRGFLDRLRQHLLHVGDGQRLLGRRGVERGGRRRRGRGGRRGRTAAAAAAAAGGEREGEGGESGYTTRGNGHLRALIEAAACPRAARNSAGR